jgi:hypothetical protein
MKLVSLCIAVALAVGAAYVAVAVPSQNSLMTTAEARR